MSIGSYKRYAHCAVTDKWIARDDMVGATFKVYNRDGSEIRMPIRLSPKGMAQLVAHLSTLTWKNVLLTAEELTDDQIAKLEVTDGGEAVGMASSANDLP